ncbi:MAG TPA: hypothetical protein VJ550_01015 [Geomonas sp.]|nr:hypothetical protein [Geomonas sp.]
MLALDGSLSRIECAESEVVELFSSPPIAINLTGTRLEPRTAYVCAVKREALVQVYAVLAAEHGRNFVYTDAGSRDNDSSYRATLDEALKLVKSMGFAPERVNLSYGAAMRAVVVRNYKIFKFPGQCDVTAAPSPRLAFQLAMEEPLPVLPPVASTPPAAAVPLAQAAAPAPAASPRAAAKGGEASPAEAARHELYSISDLLVGFASEMAELRMERDTLSVKLEGAAVELKKAQGDNARLAAERDSLAQAAAALKTTSAELAGARKELTLLAKERDEALRKQEELTARQKELTEAAGRAKEELARAQQAAAKAQQETASAKEEAAAAKKWKVGAQQVLVRAQEDIVRYQVALAKAHEAVASSQEEAARAQQEIVKAQELAARAKTDVASEKEASAKAKEELTRIKEASAKAKEELARVKEESAKTKEESARVKEESAKTKEESARAKEESARAKEESAKAKEESARAKEESARAKEESARAKEESARAREDSARAREESARTKEQTVRVEADVTRSQTELEVAAEPAGWQADQLLVVATEAAATAIKEPEPAADDTPVNADFTDHDFPPWSQEAEEGFAEIEQALDREFAGHAEEGRGDTTATSPEPPSAPATAAGAPFPGTMDAVAAMMAAPVDSDPFAGFGSADDRFFGGFSEGSGACAIFVPATELAAVEYSSPEDVLELRKSFNVAQVALDGRATEPCEGYVCALKDDGGARVYAAVYGTKSGKISVYVPETQPSDEEGVAAALVGAMTFHEQIGLLLEPLDLGQQRAQIISGCPVLKASVERGASLAGPVRGRTGKLKEAV